MSGPALGRAKPRGFVFSGIRTAPIAAALTAVRLVVRLLVVLALMVGRTVLVWVRGTGGMGLDERLLLRPLVEQLGREHRDETAEDLIQRHLRRRGDPVRSEHRDRLREVLLILV